MTKNTTRRKKRKNLKLRRTIRKTVAALIMIMAVVVAAIPVENLGTMQAQTSSGSDISMETLYKAYQEDMYNTTEENVIFDGVLSDITNYHAGLDSNNGYMYEKSDYKTIRIVPGENGAATTLNWEFMVNNRTGKAEGVDAVIVGYNRSDIKDAIEVTERLYTKYFLVTSQHIEAVRTILQKEIYKVQFIEDTTQIGCTVPQLDDSHPSFQINLKRITTNVSEQGSVYESDLQNEYTIAGSRNEFSAVNIFKEYTQLYSTKKGEIETYNNNLTNLITTVNNNQTTITTELYEKIKSDYDELVKKNEEYLKAIEFKYSDVTNTEGLEKFCIENRFSFVDKGYSYSLNGFNLETYVDENGNKGYIPRWQKQKGGATYQEDLKNFDGDANRSDYLDPKGYIQLASITVSGIGNGAFKDFKDFESITFPETIEFIGNDAFSGCLGLKSINLTNIEAVGNRAFKGCTNLSTVTFTSADETTAEVEALGAEAFYGTKLSNVVFPKTIKNIGYGCFATSQLVSFEIPGGNNDIIIWPFAFYNCSKLTKTTFPDETFSENIVIGLGAFAVSSGGEMSEFTFPNSMTDIIQSASIGKEFNLDDALTTVGEADITTETYYDYILAGRSGLKKVVFSYRLGKSQEAKVPDNTLQGCSNLNLVVFGAKCLNETNGYTTYDPEMLFRDVENQNFYVEGPGYLNQSTQNTYSKPRELTAAARAASSSYAIPYIFLTSTNPDVTRIEMSTGENDDCLAILEDIDGNADTKEVKLVKYTYNGTENIKDLVISSMIGPYKLTQLGEGCFKEVKDAVIELIIEDGSVSVIEADAFNGSKTLQKVTIGNSVKTIGEGAFANCSVLENVYFSSPKTVNSINDNSLESEWASVLTIGDNAFKTTSDYLTFHGDIHSGYAPFELAMSGASFGSSANKRTICYKTDAPQNLTVVYDHQYALSTLIDYPHYEEIDTMNKELLESVAPSRGATAANYSITDNFEAYNNWKTISDFQSASPTPEEGAVIAATYDIELPTGVQSIDAKTYINYSDNKDNIDYLYLTYTEDEKTGEFSRPKNVAQVKRVLNGSHDIKKLYSDNNAGSDVTNAGLFSGYYYEAGTGIVPDASTEKNFNGRDMLEEERTSGNDQLLEIALNTVESLPDYAFESCENLNSVGFGKELLTLGNAPFRGCESLTNVDTSNNTYFTCENGIIYRTSPGSSSNDLGTGYVIEECLMPRGNLIGLKAVNSTTDSLLSKVSGIKPEAFSYCPDIQTVDLSDTSVTVIPEECFRGASSLKEVVLPESVSRIDSKAFSDASPKVTIYSTTCQIESDAFDDGNGIIRGYMYADGSESKYSTAYQYAKNHNIQFEEITAEYTLRFLDYDGTLIETQQVEQGKDGVAPDWTPTRAGYAFKEWSWEKETGNSDSVVVGEKAYRNVTENRIILATYTVGSGIVSDGNDYKLTITGGKNIGGETTATLKGGTAVSIIADTKSGSTFQYWSESTGKYNELFENVHTDVTTFVMPNADVSITANFISGTGTGTGTNTGTGTGTNTGTGTGSIDTETKYTLTVNYGSGSGEYKAGEVVSISAYAPESSSKVFSKWTSTTTGVGFASATSATTTITMPASAVTVTANYKTRTADDEEDDEELEALNNRKGTSSTAAVTTGTNNATITTTTGTVTNTTSTPTTGDSIAISKDGISNVNIASTNVEGASDNFVVKVSDAASAVTEAEEALKNKFGSLDGILYFPMDITLFDETGKNKITDTTGLDVTVTIPIPDELIQYGGNVRVAAIENGQLQDLNVKFTTIDGIACMSFVPPHFSPYVIYVDTNNLVAGQMLDATPKTGDPIHPKWFLAIGMACLSVILFTTGDKKKKVKLA